MRNILLSLIVLALISLAFAETHRFETTSGIFWTPITNPGTYIANEITDADYPTTVIAGSDTPRAAVIVGSVGSPITDVGRAELAERVRKMMTEKYPPMLIITMTLPSGAGTADNVIFEATLPFEGGVSPTYCLQLISLETGVPTFTTTSTVSEVTDRLDYTHIVSAIPDRDGVFRFKISELAGLIDDGTIGNRFVLKPFASRDSFDAGSVSGTPFKYVLVTEE
jgi:hypothetical protein